MFFTELFYVGLPVQVRDHALKIMSEIPKSDVNKEYYNQNIEREVSVFLARSECCNKDSLTIIFLDCEHRRYSGCRWSGEGSEGPQRSAAEARANHSLL